MGSVANQNMPFTSLHILATVSLIRRGVGLWFCLSGAAVALTVWSSPLLSAAVRPSDYDVKAVYLLHFGRFATWPATTAAADESFRVCVLGRDPFGPSLDAALAGETIDGRNVVAMRIGTPQQAIGCRILFVSASEADQWPRILKSLDNAEALTVSDMPEFATRGGVIQFVSHDNKVRFEVNVTAAEQAHVRLSSDLLRVASAVRHSARPGA